MNSKLRNQVSLVLLLLAATSCVRCTSAPAAKSVNDSNPVFTLDEAKAYMAEVAPIVEQAAGKRFRRMPSVKLAKSQDLVPGLTRELTMQFRILIPDADDAIVNSAAELAAEMYAASLVGKYGRISQVLYLVPEHLRRSLEVAKVSPDLERPILKLIIAHELTHALQDQALGLSRIMARGDTMEEAMAIDATIEGHASFVQTKIAEALGLNDAQREFDRFGFANPYENGDAWKKLMAASSLELYRGVYMGGRGFIAYQHKAGGNERVWSILAHPPKTTGMILKPETYSAEEPVTVDLTKVLTGLESRFGKGDWSAQSIDVSGLQLRAIYAGLDEERREAVVSNIENARTLMAADSDGRIGNVSVMILSDASFAKTMLSSLEDMARVSAKQVSESKTAKITDPVFRDFPAAKASVARRVSFVLSMDDRELRNDFIRIVRGRALVEVYLQNIKLSDAQIAGIAETVFSRLPGEISSPVSGGKGD